MVVGTPEEIVSTVKSILKSLECPICLELLKIPVSAGCGHFFCRDCISGILQSAYRAPCPLCKRSFTRRSVQEAKQRLYVISAAETLAEICTRLTGVKLVSHDVFKEPDKAEVVTLASPKTLKSSNEEENKSGEKENQEKITRKRKSCENDDVKIIEQENVSKPTDNSSPNKRTCPDSEDSDDDDDDEDLPSIEDVLRDISASQQAKSFVDEKTFEKPVLSPEKTSEVNTYSNAHIIIQKYPVVTHSGHNIKMREDISVNIPEHEKEILSTKVALREQAKNEINALKNKTNKVNTELCNTQIVNSSVKVKSLKDDLTRSSEVVGKSKENTPSPSKILRIRRKSDIKSINDFPKVSKSNLTVNASTNAASKKSRGFIPEDISGNECYTLNQVTLFHSKDKSNAEDDGKKAVEDPFKAMRLNDTAVYVDPVTRPLSATKNISVHKSPGWSRVKKIEKDFKMKKFTSLDVEKNSSNITMKNTSVADQESTYDNNKLNDSLNYNTKNRICSKLEDASVALPQHEECDRVKSNSLITFQVHQQTSESNEKIAENTLDKVDEEMDCTVEEQETVAKCLEEKSLNSNTFSKVTEVNIIPTVSITSSSIICTKYSDDPHKISSQNVLKTQKFTCELKTSPSLNKSQNKISECIVEKDKVNIGKKLLYDDVVEVNQQSDIGEYKNLHSHRDDFQYIEQSQQTSQVLNLDFNNPFCDNSRAMVLFQPPQFLCPPVEKTKVVKQTCLTLDEIQDCFAKSSLNGSSETLYSVPFLGGEYKLHVGVSEDTLNVSVFKVINPNTESNVSSTLLTDKCIQASNSLSLPTEVLPPSHDGSESDTVDPFPYLSKKSADCKSSNFPSDMSNKTDLSENTNKEKTGHILQAQVSSSCKYFEDDPAMSDINEGNCSENENLNTSEIVHFPPASSNKDNPAQEVLNPFEIEENHEETHQDQISVSTAEINSAFEDSKQKNLSNRMSCKEVQIGSESSDEEEPFKKLKECVQKETPVTGRKLSRLSLKKKSPFRRIKVAESSDESDQEMSMCVRKKEEKAKARTVLMPHNLAPAVDNFKSPTLLHTTEERKKGVWDSTVSEMPSILTSSILSEDQSQANASEMLLEIEDLSYKIKFLEEKLKLCGHGEDIKVNQSSSSINRGSPNKSDSEDSTDIFSESVPPTPPNFM